MICSNKIILFFPLLCIGCKPNFHDYRQVRNEYSYIITYGNQHNGDPLNYPFNLNIEELKPDKSEYLINFTEEDRLVRIKHLIENDSIKQEINYYYSHQQLKACVIENKVTNSTFSHLYITGKFQKMQLKLCKHLNTHQEYYLKGIKLLNKFK